MNLFGTDGIRRKNNHFLFHSGQMCILFSAMFQCCTKPVKKLIFAHDGRSANTKIIMSLIHVSLQYNINPIFLGILPTASISLLTPELEADLGFMITASHNGNNYSGFKVFNHIGEKVSYILETKISDIFVHDRHIYYTDIPNYPLSDFIVTDYDYKKIYICYLLKCFYKRHNTYKILVSCNNGATSQIVHNLLPWIHHDCVVIDDTIDGYNINSTTRKLSYGYDYVFMFDGDGDRIAIYDDCGNNIDITQLIVYIVKLKEIRYVITTKMTPSNVISYLQQYNTQVIIADVGDRNIMDAMRKYEGSIGFEPSGHIIIDPLYPSDSIGSMLWILSHLPINRNEIYDFKPYVTQLVNIPVDQINSAVMHSIEDLFSGKNARLFIRQSGTEDVIRFLVETETHEENYELLSKIIDVVKREGVALM
ncbi:MAG: phosphoglucomutase/phosphomannomutase, alpha/beta/alpha domain II family protein [Candidatus Xenolissoclinum pacificiensis L6]|uniref:Phosphoglucomutase/phosphomannomutase, alpha/beta/alpha domain II family protein n=1 Tax=Candidatus Xenolissoclinum pacificiensis L6 TaxID=1401685 RepID=W2V0N8_9RICK|nr:MAG: phosphoglucomutase/phosphomannomutase, alpha/beta/alpha domain II family protein [Candidatus Xenolissoclinum pacificiensis L6]